MSERGDPTDELSLRFAGLNIRISRARSSSPSPSAGSFELVDNTSGENTSGARASTGPLAGTSVPAAEFAAPTPGSLLLLDSATALNAIDLGIFEHFARSIGSAGDWTAQGRIARAVRAGHSAAKKLSGEERYQATSPRLPVSNRWYVVLRCRSHPDGFATQSFKTYQDLCFDSGRRSPEAGSVSHAFASLAEGQAFAQAAGRRWPLVL